MKDLLALFAAFLIYGGSSSAQKAFSLAGMTDEIKDGTVLYLYNRLSGELMDSATVKDQRFCFKTVLPESPLNAIIRTDNYSHYRFIWLENAPMIFDDTDADFRTAVVTGSKSEDLSQSLYRDIDQYNAAEQRRREIEFVKSNPASIVSASILSTYATTWGKAETKELYVGFTAEVKNTEYAKRIARFLKLSRDLEVGDSYADLVIPDQKGDTLRLSEHTGKVTLIEFWASWCGPCRKENPNLVKTYQEYHPKGFEIYAISLDKKKENWLQAIEKDGLTWTHVSDLKGGDADAVLIYSVNAIPDNLLIDENGMILARGLRGKELEKKLASLMK